MERCLWATINDSYQGAKIKSWTWNSGFQILYWDHPCPPTCLESHLISHDRKVGYYSNKQGRENPWRTLRWLLISFKYRLSPEASGQCEEKRSDGWRIIVRNDKPDVPWWVSEVTNHEGEVCVFLRVCFLCVCACVKPLFGESQLEMLFNGGADLRHFMFLSSH